MTYWKERERLKKEREAKAAKSKSADAIAQAAETIAASIPWTYHDYSSSSAPSSYEPSDIDCSAD